MMSAISELEAAVLFLLVRAGECTPYRIRQRLAESPTARFSGSTGAVYPLIRRLQEKGLVTSRRDSRGRRAHRVCSATPAGKKELKSWILNPAGADFDVPFDPILTRVNMLVTVSPRDARSFLDSTVAVLEERLEAIKPVITELSNAHPPLGDHLGRYAVRALRARIRFLRDLASKLA